jgi:cbb3-type cytochrome oxidase subunit 1
MYPWIIILFVAAFAVFAIDYLVRRKKWRDNSKEEKISLLVNMFSVGPYLFLSAAGMLWGIVPGSPETAFGETLYDVTLMMGGTFFVVAAVVAILSLVFRKKGRLKVSIWINVVALAYIAIVLTVNSLAGKIL